MSPAMQSSERRRFLGGLASGMAFVSGLQAAAAKDAIMLRAVPGRISLLEDESVLTSVWGFNGQVPGPVLRARQGEPFRVRLANALDQPLAIHWHGIRLGNSMDGTALTQTPVAPGGMFDYAFSPPDAGTYWYHPLVNASGLRGRGLSGLLLVEEKDSGSGQGGRAAGDRRLASRSEWAAGRDLGRRSLVRGRQRSLQQPVHCQWNDTADPRGSCRQGA